VGQAEIVANPAASQAIDHEWARLRDAHVWDEDNPRDWVDVRQEAKVGNFDLHLGHICGNCVEQNSEMEAAYKKYKGRVVFLGNALVDQYHDETHSVTWAVHLPHWRLRKQLTFTVASLVMPSK
jgi:hypothetical protein